MEKGEAVMKNGKKNIIGKSQMRKLAGGLVKIAKGHKTCPPLKYFFRNV